MKALGCHLLLELMGCPVELLKDRDFIESSLTEAAKRAKTHVINKHFHTFNPHGVSGAIVIAESHISIHTWPELAYAALDIFTCGDNALPQAGVEYLIDAFTPRESKIVQVDRGIFGPGLSLLTPKIYSKGEKRCEFKEAPEQIEALA